MNDIDAAFIRYVTACLIAHGVDISLLLKLTQTNQMQLIVDAFWALPTRQIPFHEWCKLAGLDCAREAAKEFELSVNDKAFGVTSNG